MLLRRLLVCSMFVLLTVTRASAVAGTSRVADTGQKAYVSPDWPKGVDALLNDPRRTEGWNDWFSGWPSDVNHYAYQIGSMDDVNRLLKLLGDVQGDLRQVVLSPLAEPRGLGWVTCLPEGNAIPLVLSIGDQSRSDQWYERLPDGKFGVMVFESKPVAVPPTLTIFIGHAQIDLDKLEVPQGVEVTTGYVPTHFHRWNTQADRERAERAAAGVTEPPTAKSDAPPVPPEVSAAQERIDAFLAKRRTPEARE